MFCHQEKFLTPPLLLVESFLFASVYVIFHHICFILVYVPFSHFLKWATLPSCIVVEDQFFDGLGLISDNLKVGDVIYHKKASLCLWLKRRHWSSIICAIWTMSQQLRFWLDNLFLLVDVLVASKCNIIDCWYDKIYIVELELRLR